MDCRREKCVFCFARRAVKIWPAARSPEMHSEEGPKDDVERLVDPTARKREMIEQTKDTEPCCSDSSLECGCPDKPTPVLWPF